MSEDRTGTLRKIRALIDKANATQYEEERNTFLEAADRLMLKYSVAEFELAMARPAHEREKPEVREWDLHPAAMGQDYEYQKVVFNLFYAVAGANRCIVADYGWKCRVIGYSRDLDHVDMVFTSLLLFMASELSPSGDVGISLGENLYKMKMAGLKWETIHKLLRTKGVVQDEPWERRHGVRYTGVYKKFCDTTGKPQITKEANPKKWREGFANGFLYRLRQRFEEQKRAAESEPGVGLVLHGMEDAIKEALYEMHPDRRPHPKECECDTCHFLRCDDQACQRTRCVNARKPVRYRAPKEYVTSAAAFHAGQASANRADLGGGRVGTTNKGVIK